MYLSRLILNPRNAGARRDVARPYELHRTLMRTVEHAPEGERLLFRIEPEPGPGGPVVLVQSAEAEPDWAPLLDNAYLLEVAGPKGFAPALRRGQHLRFRLTANPVKKVNGKRIPLIIDNHEDEQVKTYWDWLHRQAERCGFQYWPRRTHRFTRPRPGRSALRTVNMRSRTLAYGLTGCWT